MFKQAIGNVLLAIQSQKPERLKEPLDIHHTHLFSLPQGLSFACSEPLLVGSKSLAHKMFAALVRRDVSFTV